MFKKIPLNKGDVFGGITAGVVALPLALAFGVQSGLGAIYGLYGAIFLGIFAALFGGTATQISGPHRADDSRISGGDICSAINLWQPRPEHEFCYLCVFIGRLISVNYGIDACWQIHSLHPLSSVIRLLCQGLE